MTTVSTYLSVHDYRSSDARRLSSPEVDFGAGWRRHDVYYRLTWVEDTHELLAIQMARGAFAGDAGTVTVLASASRGWIEDALSGWQDIVGRPDSFLWVRRRLIGAGLA